MKRLALLVALALAGCAEPPTTPIAPRSANGAISVVAAPVPLNPTDPSQDHIGRFQYAGGLMLASADTSQLHGLSDLRVARDGRLVSESDEGHLLAGRIVLDSKGRLVGLADTKLTALLGPDGKPLPNKQESDAEGLAIMGNGDLLISFERHHRILRYPAHGGPPTEVPSPRTTFPDNGGMEGLVQSPADGPDAYLVGGEDSGQTWTCHLTKACQLGPRLSKPDEYGLVALATLPKGRLAYMIRAWDPLRGSRISLIILDAGRIEIDRMELSKPLTVDNLEGLAAVPGRDGQIRFYLISDDNFQPSQRTLLLAFDWAPPGP